MAKKPSQGSSRGQGVRVKTAKKRSTSSTRWLQRQLNDPYVQLARREGYRSRAAFKLLELDEKFGLLRPGDTVVDLGCAPGGWTQVAVKKTGARGKVIGIDLLEVDPVAGADIFVLDFLADDAPEIIKKRLRDAAYTVSAHPQRPLPTPPPAGEGMAAATALVPSPHRGEDRGAREDGIVAAAAGEGMGTGRANLVLSDMAANATGHAPTDHIRIIHLCDLAYQFATEILSPGGAFVCKVLKGGTERELLKKMQRDFVSVKHAKPAASRSDSAESYVVARGFRG